MLLGAPPAHHHPPLPLRTTPRAPAAAPGTQKPRSTRGAVQGSKPRWTGMALLAAAGGDGSAAPDFGVHARGEGPRCASGRRPALSHQALHAMNRRRQALRHAARRLGRCTGCSWLAQGLPAESAVVAAPQEAPAGARCSLAHRRRPDVRRWRRARTASAMRGYHSQGAALASGAPLLGPRPCRPAARRVPDVGPAPAHGACTAQPDFWAKKIRGHVRQ